MKEEFLHYVWKFQLLDAFNELSTINEAKVEVLEKGIYNQNSGPDFLNAKVKIGNTIWAGNIEIHVNSSDWDKHNHQKDAAYDNVILHVVYNHDSEVKNSKNETIPTLELKNHIGNDRINNYQNLVHRNAQIPCDKQLNTISEFDRNNWLERLLFERLERKSKEVEQVVQELNGDLEEAFYIQFSMYFGQKVNSDAFMTLAKNLPLKILGKHRGNLFQIESLLYGVAGFLSESIESEYHISLRKEFKFLKSKYQLTELPKVIWKFSKLRPPNFPTVRIAQLAKILNNNQNLFSRVVKETNLDGLKLILSENTSKFWINHYTFNKASKEKVKTLGAKSIEVLLINSVVPFLFYYGNKNGQEDVKNKAISWLEKIPAENNSIVNQWLDLGIKSPNAFYSQALIQLKNEYCIQKKCLNCNFGIKILGNDR